MSKRNQIHIFTTGIILIALAVTFGISKIFVNDNIATATSYVFGLFIGYCITSVAFISDEELKDVTNIMETRIIKYQ